MKSPPPPLKRLSYFLSLRLVCARTPPPGVATPVYGLDRYVLTNGVWLLRVSIRGGVLGLIFVGYVLLAS